MIKLFFSVSLAVFIVGCSDSDNNDHSPSLHGSYITTCINSRSITFPGLLNNFINLGYGKVEMNAEGQHFAFTFHAYLDENCLNYDQDISLFEGFFEIRNEKQGESGEKINEIFVSGSYPVNPISIEKTYYVLVNDDEVYFSNELATSPSIDYDLAYVRI